MQKGSFKHRTLLFSVAIDQIRGNRVYSNVTLLTIPSFSSVSGGVGAGVSSSIRRGVIDELLAGRALKDRLRTPGHRS